MARSGLALCSPTSTEQRTTSWEARIPPGQVAAIELGQAQVTVAIGWKGVPAEPYEHHPCFSRVVARARQFPDHANPDLRPLVIPGLDAGKSAA